MNDLISKENKFYKEHSVVMLPTEKASKLILDNNGKGDLVLWHKPITPITAIPQHLYFLSDEEIKVGDWFISTFGLWQHNGNKPDKSAVKVIATTNPELLKFGTCNKCGAYQFSSYLVCNYNGICNGKVIPSLPRPSNAFLEAYVREYNKGNKIESVLIEYDYIKPPTHFSSAYDEYFIKLAPDNTITIKKLQS